MQIIPRESAVWSLRKFKMTEKCLEVTGNGSLAKSCVLQHPPPSIVESDLYNGTELSRVRPFSPAE